MSLPAGPSATTAIATTLALIDQFSKSLSPNTQHDVPVSVSDAPSPLLLLSAAAKALKAQSTKLSLLTVTIPFTASALATCLQTVNDSILPSLVTATLLADEEAYTASFATECKTLTRLVLQELHGFMKLVQSRNTTGRHTENMSVAQKKEVTEATGRVWECCDAVVRFADDDLAGFAVRKAKQWLELMKDAVKELQEWDPEEEVDPDDIFGDIGSDDADEIETNGVDGKKEDPDRATISAGVKDQALKVLSRIPQSVHVVVKQRLEKIKGQSNTNLPRDARTRLDRVLNKTRTVSELIDESAEGMYFGNLELCLKKAGEARAITIEIVEVASTPFATLASTNGATGETAEDKYVKRALDWIRQVETTTTLPHR